MLRALSLKLLAVATVVSSLGFLAPSAFAVGQWEARYISECCYLTIESGAVERQFFTLLDAGTQTWGAPGTPSVDLGTDEPRDRASVFRAPDWPQADMPVVGVSHQVHPGQSYKFAFDVKAPPVAAPSTYRESFGLLAQGVTWMDSTSGLGPVLWLEYKVLPAHPPSVSMPPSLGSVVAGNPVSVTAHAAGVASLNRIVFQFAGQAVVDVVPRNPEIAPDEHAEWNASPTFSTAGLSPGPQTVVATAYDDAGLSATTTATVLVTAVKGGPATPVLARPGILIGGRHSTIARVVASQLAAGTTVTFSCRRCSGAAKTTRRHALHGQATWRPRQLRVSSRSRLVIYVTRSGAYGHFKAYRFPRGRIGAGTLSAEGCLAPGSLNAVRCP